MKTDYSLLVSCKTPDDYINLSAHIILGSKDTETNLEDRQVCSATVTGSNWNLSNLIPKMSETNPKLLKFMTDIGRMMDQEGYEISFHIFDNESSKIPTYIANLQVNDGATYEIIPLKTH